MRTTIILALILATGVLTSKAQSKADLMGYAPTTDTSKWERRGEFILLKQTYKAFDKMQKAAAKDGVKLYVVSAYRSAERQKAIWERKWNDKSRASKNTKERALDILQYSSMPGTSRHHWGTDLDICSVEPKYFDQNQEGQKIYKWLVENASEYGFFQPYTAGRTRGYAQEKWHWSYRPISDKYLQTYLETIKDVDLKGFAGSEVATQIKMVENWVKL